MAIKTWRDYRRYLREDMAACAPRLARWWPWHAIRYPVLGWQRKLRLAEYMHNRASGPVSRAIGLACQVRARQAGIRFGFTIPVNTFGPGLNIAHWGTIVVNDRARIGARCRIHPGTCIATKNGAAPVLGDRCFVAPGAKLIGGIVLGDDVRIGANAVVLGSFPSGATLVGVPARQVIPSRASA